MTSPHSTIDNRQSPRATAVSAVLRTAAGTSSPAQRKKLVIAAKRKGIEVYELRGLVGGRLHDLSSADASAWIKRLSGDDLPHPPGAAPPSYPRRRDTSRERKGAVRPTARMIAQAHLDQIGRLMLRYFDNNPAPAIAWFRKNWKCDDPRELGTTERAGQVIAALNTMLARKDENPSPRGRGPGEGACATAVSAVQEIAP